ncbi:uncharacterized protein PADG_12139 [Paracoccidioides brasiliensis Pb18]|uniref:Uncharacterized protein n=1 Tax=Paracoccidioides brasiliensis (strain Pb18) TaxID=502780 RepID=A0A0A0HUX8_PARBD|nr:uncharacterized protein PADG_12139 [Paracoccidioides brasiliensis Pb18]KGM91821.1 hypothetical protein PADG_12139 [Paracoccidioides brasiliensis Pb18]
MATSTGNMSEAYQSGLSLTCNSGDVDESSQTPSFPLPRQGQLSTQLIACQLDFPLSDSGLRCRIFYSAYQWCGTARIADSQLLSRSPWKVHQGS